MEEGTHRLTQIIYTDGLRNTLYQRTLKILPRCRPGALLTEGFLSPACAVSGQAWQ